MKVNNKYIIGLGAVGLIFTACNTFEKASTHGLNSGIYTFETKREKAQKVYVDVTDENLDVYRLTKNQPEKRLFLTIPFKPTDSLMVYPMVFKKQSLDIDITSVLLKYRPSVYGLQAQLTTDFNLALYAGWRFDKYKLINKRDLLGKGYHKIISRGYDFGVFAGPGATLISPFTTQNKRTEEYSGLIIQSGFAGFIETNSASFGFAIGFDYLLNSDREVWIYTNKPWVGFVVGIALN